MVGVGGWGVCVRFREGSEPPLLVLGAPMAPQAGLGLLHPDGLCGGWSQPPWDRCRLQDGSTGRVGWADARVKGPLSGAGQPEPRITEM